MFVHAWMNACVHALKVMLFMPYLNYSYTEIKTLIIAK